jgi:hypothetical protein
MKTGRTPLKQPPLRNPGESLMKHRDAIIDDKLMPVVAIATTFLVISAYLWLDHFGILPFSLPVFTVIALGMGAYTAWKFRQSLTQIRLLNRGIEAEKAMGQFLEQFRAKEYAIFHDIPVESGGKKFNIDHVLVGPKGIFTIETKSRTKPLKGHCKIAYDGETVSINGHAPDPAPIIQAKGEASWIRDYIASCTALKSIPVTPIVVFPGWYIDYLQAGDAKVRVANEQLIWSCIQHSPHQLDPHDAKLIESRLTDYIQRQSIC